jgi:hypothetical protein
MAIKGSSVEDSVRQPLKGDVKPSERLNLKVGEWVEIRSRADILATLDEHGRLENLPFMPEMFQY